MRKFTKVLSAILAMAMLFSMVSVGVEAAYAPYKDANIGEYNSIDQPVLTTDQYGSMIVDELDRMLAEEAIIIDEDLGGILNIYLDCTSVDAALDSVVSLWNQVEGAKATIGGDVVNLDFSAITSAPRRNTPGKTDLDIVYSLLQFLADNSGIVGKVADGSLDLGFISGFVSINDYLNIPNLLKKLLAEEIYDDEDYFPEDFDENTPGNQTYDQMSIDWYIEKFIFYFIEKEELTDKIPAEILELIDINGISVYNLIEQVIKLGLNEVGVKLLNNDLKIRVRKLCGVDYSGMDKDDRRPYNGDTSDLNQVADFIDIDYEIPEYDFSSWKTGDSWIDHVNDFVGWIITNIDNEEAGFVVEWNFDDGNEGLLGNIANLTKQLLSATGSQFFPDYVTIPTPEEYNAMTDEELVCFIAAATINGSIEGIFITDDQDDSILEMLFYVAKHYAATYVPSFEYGEFEDYDDPMYATLDILADVLAYAMNQFTNANLSYEVGFDEVLQELLDWVLDNYAGFLSLSGDSSDIWELLDEILFTIIPSNWIAERDVDGDGVGDEPRNSFYDILFVDLIENLSELDLMGIINLFSRNYNDTGDNESELDHSLTYVIINRVSAIFNLIIPGVFSDDYENFDDLIAGNNGAKLKNVFTNLLNGLNSEAPRILESALPLVCMFMDLSTDQEFEYPYISLPETITSSTSSFYINNESSGLNTAANYADGTFEQDSLYKYEILSVKTNQSNVTVSPATAVINGGEHQTFTINGTPAQNNVLMITVTYNVLNEQGNSMTTSPIVENVITFVSDTEDDSDADVNADVNQNNAHYIQYNKTEYINQKGNLSSVGGTKIDIIKNYVDGGISSNITARTVTPDARLAAIGLTENVDSGYLSFSISRKGGSATDRPLKMNNDLFVYEEEKVDENGDVVYDEAGNAVMVTKYRRPANGIYANTFSYTLSPSTSNGAEEKINFTQNVYFYDDFDLPSLLKSAVNANRQASNYSKDTIEIEKEFYDEIMDEYYTEIITLNGEECWDAYMSAILNAASVVYRPRLVGTFATTHGNKYEAYAAALKEAVENLAYFELETGVTAVKNAYNSIIPEEIKYETDKVDEQGNVIYRDAYYYEEGYVFFERIDHVGYTYERFKDIKEDAEDMIEDAEKGGVFSPIEIAYLANRLSLYGARLIRVQACADRLEEDFADAEATYTAGNTGYSEKTWNNFVTAYEFAEATLDEAVENPGTCYPGTNYLKDDGVRQSKINVAREQLNEARKELRSDSGSTPSNDADLTALRNEIENNSAAIYEAGIEAGPYTELTWLVFAGAYEEALAALEAGYTADQQDIVNTLCQNLVSARENLATESLQPEIIFNENYDGSLLQFTVDAFDIDYNSVTYIFGANPDDPWIADYNMVEGLIYDYDASYEGYEVVWASVNNAFENYGTGSTIEIWLDGEVLESYAFVIFGDVDGDTICSAADFNMILSVANGIYADWCGTGWFMDNAQMFACDINNDWSIDASDANIALNAGNGIMSIDQSEERIYT